MKVKVKKRSIQLFLGRSLNINYSHFSNNILKGKLLKEKEFFLIIDINIKNYNKQKFNNKIWYRSKCKKFGLFQNNDSKIKWRLLFQRK